jgi:hypothetical protein
MKPFTYEDEGLKHRHMPVSPNAQLQPQAFLSPAFAWTPGEKEKERKRHIPSSNFNASVGRDLMAIGELLPSST